MRLLQRSAVVKAKTNEREQAIAEGAKLAKRVDALRELSAKEEKQLMDFREKTMDTIRVEIERLNQEKRVLVGEIKSLGIERKLLLEPLDASWDEIVRAQKICDEREINLNIRMDEVAAREDENKLRSATLKKRNALISEKEEIVKEVVEAATKMLADATQVLAQARNDAQTAKTHSELLGMSLTERESNVAIRERDVEIGKEVNARVRKANIAQQIILADERVALDAGFKELNKK